MNLVLELLCEKMGGVRVGHREGPDLTYRTQKSGNLKDGVRKQLDVFRISNIFTVYMNFHVEYDTLFLIRNQVFS